MHVTYRGDILAPSGYSRAIRNHMRALIEAGIIVHGEISQHDKVQLRDELCVKHPFWMDHMNDVLAKHPPCTVKIWHETPEFFQPDPTQYNIAYTVWETSKIIDFDLGDNPLFNWVNQLNRMDEVWTACEFNAGVFQASGVNRPIRVFPHPIDLERYSPGEPAGRFLVDRQAMEGKMVFMSVFQFTKRKNPHDLILAWTAEFPFQDDVALVIKTYGSDFGDNSDIVRYINGMRQGSRVPNLSKNLHLILELIPDQDMCELYRMCDVFVLPSHGEGFGMPYQEAMACGKPVIYTDATSMPEFCVGYPVACDPEPVMGMNNIPWYNSLQDWWKTRVKDLRRAMRKAYDDWRNETLHVRGAEARQRVESLHSFAAVGRAMRDRLEEIAEEIRSGSCRPELADYWNQVDPEATLLGPPAS